MGVRVHLTKGETKLRLKLQLAKKQLSLICWEWDRFVFCGLDSVRVLSVLRHDYRVGH